MKSTKIYISNKIKSAIEIVKIVQIRFFANLAFLEKYKCFEQF